MAILFNNTIENSKLLNLLKYITSSIVLQNNCGLRIIDRNLKNYYASNYLIYCSLIDILMIKNQSICDESSGYKHTWRLSLSGRKKITLSLIHIRILLLVLIL